MSIRHIRFFTAVLVACLVACGSGRSDNEYYASAASYYAAGDLQEALVETKNALKINPENVQARLLRAKVNLQLDNPAAAADDLLRAQELNATDVELKPLLARALYRQSRYEEALAIDHLSLTDSVALADLRVTQALAASAKGDESPARLLISEARQLDPTAVYTKLGEAKIHLTSKQYAVSRKITAEILQQHPDYTPALSLMGLIEFKMGNMDAADKAYSRAIEQQPFPFDDLLARAHLRIAEQRFDDADADLRLLEELGGRLMGIASDSEAGRKALVKQDLRYIAVVYARGLLLYEQQQYEAAASLFEQVLGKSKDYLPALLLGGAAEFELGRHAQAEQKMHKVIEQQPGHLVASRLLAMNRLRMGDFEEAEFVLREALRKNPNDPITLTLLAQGLMARGETNAALELLRRVVTLQPESPQARLALAEGLKHSKMSGEAESELEAALASDPAMLPASTGLVSLRLSRGETDSALSAAKEFAQINPTSPAAQNLLASTYLNLDDVDAARKSFTRALELQPGDTVASEGLATLAMMQGKPDVARGHYQSALSYHPESLSTLLGLAALEARAGREQESIASLQLAIAAHPEELEPRLRLALVYLMRDRAAEVPDVLNPVRAHHPNSVPLLWLLADSARQTKQLNIAIELYREAAQLAPNNPRLRYAVTKTEAATGDLKNASEHLLAVLRLDPMLHPARADYARELLRNSQLEEAGKQVAWLRQQKYITPDTLLVEGRILESNDNLPGARAKYLQIFDLSPNNINLLRLEDILWRQHQYKDAIERMENWLAVYPKDLLTQLQLARRYELGGRHADAARTLESLVATHPDNVTAKNDLAWLLRDSNPPRALELARQANAMMPESAHIMDTLSVLLMKEGGEQQLRQAVQLNRLARASLADEPRVVFHTAQIQHATGDMSGARATLQILLQHHPDFERRTEAEQLLASLAED